MYMSLPLCLPVGIHIHMEKLFWSELIVVIIPIKIVYCKYKKEIYKMPVILCYYYLFVLAVIDC